MDEELFRLVTTGLLGLIVLLLLLALARLGKLQRRSGDAKPDDAQQETESPVETEAVALPVAPTETQAGSQSTETGSDAEGPYERDGRWWFRRDGELLVYDERTEEWVDPNVPEPAPVPDPSAAGAPEPELHPLEEARGWDTAPADATQAPIPEPVSAPEPITQAEPMVTDTPTETSDASGGHWKCPACGVINGSTATSCRMCFSARP